MLGATLMSCNMLWEEFSMVRTAYMWEGGVISD